MTKEGKKDQQYCKECGKTTKDFVEIFQCPSCGANICTQCFEEHAEKC